MLQSLQDPRFVENVPCGHDESVGGRVGSGAEHQDSVCGEFVIRRRELAFRRIRIQGGVKDGGERLFAIFGPFLEMLNSLSA